MGRVFPAEPPSFKDGLGRMALFEVSTYLPDVLGVLSLFQEVPSALNFEALVAPHL